MRYLALACDYDGTLAHHGVVDESTLNALKRVRASGRKLILVTGRQLDDLASVFPHLDLFEWAVVENGALLYEPSSRQEKELAERPPDQFAQVLRERGVGPLSVGRVIVATWQPHEKTVLEVIAEKGLELQVIFNKGAVMVLPAGVNKATGLTAALKELGLSVHNVVGVGDAENDHAFLSVCECAVAVANSIPALKERADFVTRGDHGTGVIELVDELVRHDLRHWDGGLSRHYLLLGTAADGAEVRLRPHGVNVLIAGPSGSGKSTVAASILERLVDHGYQFCIIDPEGDYQTFEHAVTLGDSRRPPTTEEVLQLLKNPVENLVVNLVGLALADRPAFFMGLLPLLQEMRSRTGRPHWIVVDEAHHLLPASWEPGPQALPQAQDRLLVITVHPDQVSAAALTAVDTVIAVGSEPETTLVRFCATVKESPPEMPAGLGESGRVILWARATGDAPRPIRVEPGRAERRRHVRKYAEGELPPERSFYFRGPEQKLNLRAQNLLIFMQMADGVDDATWVHHLKRGDYSTWFREKIKDEALAAEVQRVEELSNASPAETRSLVKGAIDRFYTLPASAPVPMPGAG